MVVSLIVITLSLSLFKAVIFVLDSTDKIRMCVAKDELEQMLNHEDLIRKPIPILLFANKVSRKHAYISIQLMFLYCQDGFGIGNYPVGMHAATGITENC